MKRDGRLSVALHALLHLAEARDALTSERLAEMMQSHPVVMRRTLAGLRDAGIVRSEKGKGGGFALGRPLAETTLLDVYDALGIATAFALGPRTESPGCAVERVVNATLRGALDDADRRLRAHLGALTLASLAAEVGAVGPHAKRRKGHPSHGHA